MHEDSTIIFTMSHTRLFLSDKDKILRHNNKIVEKIERQLGKVINYIKYKRINKLLVNDVPRLSVALPIEICLNQFKSNNKSSCDIPKQKALKQRESLTNILFKLKGYLVC